MVKAGQKSKPPRRSRKAKIELQPRQRDDQPSVGNTETGNEVASTVHHLGGAKDIASAAAFIGTPNIALAMTFAEMAEYRAIIDRAITELQNMRQRFDGLLRGLGPQERRAADMMREIWPPEGRPPPDLILEAICQQVTTEFIRQKLPSPPSRDTISGTLKKLGFRP